jgi:metal-responsive CopG/Arc/MetJ family transcriptional regulator
MKPKRFTEKVFVALAPITLAKLDKIAANLTMSRSEYIRTLIEADISERKSKPPAIQEKT